MKTYATVALLTLAVVLPGAMAKPVKDAKQDDAKDIQGTWVVVSGRKAGKDLPKEEIGKLKLVIGVDKVDAVTVLGDGQPDRVEPALYKIDPTKPLREIDIMPQAGPNHPNPPPADLKVLGVYELKGDELKIAFGKMARPTTLTPEADNNDLAIMTFKREKTK